MCGIIRVLVVFMLVARSVGCLCGLVRLMVKRKISYKAMVASKPLTDYYEVVVDSED